MRHPPLLAGAALAIAHRAFSAGSRKASPETARTIRDIRGRSSSTSPSRKRMPSAQISPSPPSPSCVLRCLPVQPVQSTIAAATRVGGQGSVSCLRQCPPPVFDGFPAPRGARICRLVCPRLDIACGPSSPPMLTIQQGFAMQGCGRARVPGIGSAAPLVNGCCRRCCCGLS